MQRCVAIIPARSESKRLVRKNALPIGGKWMFEWPTIAAVESGIFQEVYVVTSDDGIMQRAWQRGAKTLEHPPETADMRVVDVIEHVLAKIPIGDAFCCIYATACFLTANDLQGSWQRWFKRYDDFDAVVATVEGMNHPWKALSLSSDGETVMPAFPKWFDTKSNRFPEAVYPAGMFYWSKWTHFLRHRDFWHGAEDGRVMSYLIDHMRAIDIDTEEDYEFSKAVMEAMK